MAMGHGWSVPQHEGRVFILGFRVHRPERGDSYGALLRCPVQGRGECMRGTSSVDGSCRLRYQMPCLWKALVYFCTLPLPPDACRCCGALKVSLWVSARRSVVVVDGCFSCVLLGGRRLPLCHPEGLSLHK